MAITFGSWQENLLQVFPPEENLNNVSFDGSAKFESG